MINSSEILQTIHMFDQQHLDIRTITMGISLLDCADPDPKAACRKVYDKICRRAQNLVATGQTIEKEFGIPIVNKRVSVTPISLVASGKGLRALDGWPTAMTADMSSHLAPLVRSATDAGLSVSLGVGAAVMLAVAIHLALTVPGRRAKSEVSHLFAS